MIIRTLESWNLAMADKQGDFSYHRQVVLFDDEGCYGRLSNQQSKSAALALKRDYRIR